MRTAPLLLALALATLALAGCITRERDDGHNGEEANLTYTGRDTGDHDADVYCDGDATITAGITLASGTIAADLKDAAGKTVWSATYTTADRADSATATGKQGVWTLHVERQGTGTGTHPFDGAYGIRVAC